MAAPLTPQDPLDEAASIRSEIATPGFWDNLAVNASTWANEITAGPFWGSLTKSIDQWRTEYRQQCYADLLVSPGLPAFMGKRVDSIRDKFCRRWKRGGDSRNTVLPVDGPPIPQLRDLVRTRLTCPYVDGVEFLATKIETAAKDMEILLSRERQGSLQGYFAQHIAIKQLVFYRVGGAAVAVGLECEIQIATALATRMWDASHPVYETVRQDDAESREWQWKPADPRFLSNQLGHMLHLADGLLVQLRESLRKPRK